MPDINREQLEAQLKAAQNEEAQEIMNEIRAVLDRHSNRYALIGRPQFTTAGGGAWVVTVDVALAPVAQSNGGSK